VEVTDSAGIRVVLNPFPEAAEVPLWILGGEPRAEIGVVDGADEYQLFDVSDAVVLYSGGLAVANRGTHEVRYYDAQGQFLRSVGGEGDGPGEFRGIQFVGRFEGDSVLVFDERHRRASVFDEQGRFIRSFSLNMPTNTGRPSPVGVLSSGSIIIREDHPYIAGVAPTGRDRSPVPLFLVIQLEGEGTRWVYSRVLRILYLLFPTNFGSAFVL
jgi:hypothetical protein